MAQSVVGALRVVLGLDTAQFEKGMTAAQKQLRSVAKSMQQTGQGMMLGGAVMTAAITAPFVALIVQSKAAAIESRNAVGQVESALTSMGNAAGRSKDQLLDQAKALQALSVFDDDDILTKVTANLLTFGKVSGDVFDRAQVAAVDMTARLGGDLQGATMMLGKSLNDPVKGMTALTRAGVSLDKATQDQIKSLVKQGNLHQAQVILLAEVERQFRGAAKAQRDADPDSAARDQWRELQETLGDIALKVLPPLTAALAAVMGAFNNLSPDMQAIVVGGVAIAAALGPVITIMGGMVSAGGSIVGMLAKWGPSMGTAAGGSSLLGKAMVGLRGSMMFLVTTPWGLLIAAIAISVGLLVVAINKAGQPTREFKEAIDSATLSAKAYKEAAEAAATATGEGAKAAKEAAEAKRLEAIQTRDAAAAKLAEARATLAALNVERMRRIEFENAPGGNRGDAAGYTGAGQAVQRRRAEAERRMAQEGIDEANALIAAGDAALARSAAGGGAGGAGGGSGSGSSSGGKSAEQRRQEAEQRRRTIEDMAYQVDLQEAQLTNNLDQVRVLERQEAVRQRTRALVDAGIHRDTAAAVEAERVQVRLDAARAQQIEREHVADRRQHDMALNSLEGREDLNQSIEHQIQYEERLAFWQSQQLDLLSAQNAARLDMVQIENARAVAAEREARASEQQHQIELARLRGDDKEERRLNRLAEIEARAREYQTRAHNPLDPSAARRRAERDVAELDDAEMTGRFRSFIKEGWQAALDGDLSDFAQRWVTEWAGRGLEDALNSLADLIKRIFQSTDFGSIFKPSAPGAGGGGFDWSSIGSTVSSWFKKLPGFANGGSILPGGSGGIDSQLVQFRKTPNERVDIYKPGAMKQSSGSPMNFYLDGAVMTADLLTQMEAMASASGGAAIRGAREVVPRDQAKADRYTFRGRR